MNIFSLFSSVSSVLGLLAFAYALYNELDKLHQGKVGGKSFLSSLWGWLLKYFNFTSAT